MSGWTLYVMALFAVLVVVFLVEVQRGKADYKKHPERYSEPPWSKRK